MKKNAIIIMLVTVLSKAFGLIRDITLSYYYGTSYISDVYLIALTIPMVIFAIIGTTITTGYIPMYTNIMNTENEDTANKYTSNLMNITLLLSTISVIVAWLFTKEIVNLFAFGFKGETLSLAIVYTRISFLSIYFTGLTYIFTGYLQIKENYIIPALIGIPMNITFVFSVILSAQFNNILLPLGIVLAYLAQLIFLIPTIKRNKFKYSFSLDFQDNNIKKMIKLSIPVMIGVSVNQLNTIIDRTIASMISVGGISALNYADRINILLQGVVVASIATVIYPKISNMVVEKRYIELKKILASSILSINIFIIPATIGSLIFSEPIITLLYGRGAFDAEAIKLTSTALIFYSIGMPAFGIREILSRFFYAMQDTKTPMINAAIGMIINIGLNIILAYFLGIAGLALGTSIAGIIIAYLMIKTLKVKIGSFGMKNISISFLKILFASLIMGLLAKICFDRLTISLDQNLSLLIAIGIGGILYCSIIYFMKIEDVDMIINVIKNKLRKGI